MRRDEVVKDKLAERHIRQLIVWECTIKAMQRNPEIHQHTLYQITTFIRSSTENLEL